MFLEERYDKIIKMVEDKGRMSVKDLSSIFKVTEDCIRKDLRELEKRGKVKRVHGGAITNRSHNDIKHINERKEINSGKKQEIAKRAFNEIEDGDIVFLDVSSINLELAQIIGSGSKKVIVVSNMPQVSTVLNDSKDNITLIIVGGEFNKKVGAMIGAFTNQYISQFTFDKSFVGVCGINEETGWISTLNMEDGATKKTIIDNSNKSYLVMEEEKYNYDEFYKFAKLDEQVQFAILEVLKQQNKISKEEIEIIKTENSKLLEEKALKEKQLKEKEDLITTYQKINNELEEKSRNIKIKLEEKEKEKLLIREQLAKEFENNKKDEIDKLNEKLKIINEEKAKLLQSEKENAEKLKNNNIQLENKVNELENKLKVETTQQKELIKKEFLNEKVKSLRKIVIKDILELANLITDNNLDLADETILELERTINVFKYKNKENRL